MTSTSLRLVTEHWHEERNAEVMDLIAKAQYLVQRGALPCEGLSPNINSIAEKIAKASLTQITAAPSA